jgi:exopolyphosphatase/guanosine-5'-triphosphate,3'-diphosphate pyrophosphatase
MDAAQRPGTRRVAVIDLGSNTFRLVVFTDEPGAWWRRTDEIYEPVRISAGMGDSNELQPGPMERAVHTIEAYDHFCRASGLTRQEVQAVATSAIRDATNREDFLARAATVSDLAVRVLKPEEEARYGYLAAVNSTTLADGAVLDLGGGSLQLIAVENQQAGELGSWPLGAVRMTERFLPEKKPSKKQLKALRGHVRETLADATWLPAAGQRLIGIGGTVRNLAAALQHQADLPSLGVQGFVIEREALSSLVSDLADMSPSDRSDVKGIKPERADVILAGAAVIEAVLEFGEFAAVETTEAGLREGIFFETHLAGQEPPVFEDVRGASVRNLAGQYHADQPHVGHVAQLALAMFDALARDRVIAGDHEERELLWAAAMLHDIGMTVDYDDHHKHSRYLILNAGLPGFSPRELALIALMARYHRKGSPSFGDLEALMETGDEDRLARGAALLRLAEQLERTRDQLVREVRVGTDNGRVSLELIHDGDASVAYWAAVRQVDLFEEAFGRELQISA